MGMEFCESWAGFKLGNTTDSVVKSLFLARWTSLQPGGVADVVSSDSSGNYVTANSQIYKTTTHQSGWTYGFRFRLPSLPGGGGITIFNTYNNNHNLGFVRIEADGTISLLATDFVLIGTSPPPTIQAGTWYYMEISQALSGTTNILNTMSLRLNGKQVISGAQLTGINASTLTSQTATANRFAINGVGSGCDFRDIYINNQANQFFGDVQIVGVRPNGDVVIQWTPQPGPAHYTMVNETYCNFDVNYVNDGTLNDQDIWDWQDIATFVGTVKSIQVSIHARKDAEGSKALKIVTGDTGSENQSPDYYLADDYVCYTYPQDVDPATGLAWTVAGFNAKRFGVRVSI